MTTWQHQDNPLSLSLTGLDAAAPAEAASSVEHSPDGSLIQIFAGGGEENIQGATLSDLIDQLRSPDQKIRLDAAQKLGILQDIRALPNLLKTLSDETDWIAQYAVIWALGQLAIKITDLRTMPDLTTYLQAEQWPVRRVSAWALGRLKDTRVIRFLLGALDDSYSPVREAAVWALGQIGDKSTAQSLAAAVQDANLDVARQAIAALGCIDSKKSLPLLIAALEDDRKPVRYAAVRAMAQRSDSRAFSVLLSMLHASDITLQKITAEALAELVEKTDNSAAHATVYQALLDLWSDPHGDPDLRRIVGQSMARVHACQTTARK